MKIIKANKRRGCKNKDVSSFANVNRIRNRDLLEWATWTCMVTLAVWS